MITDNTIRLQDERIVGYAEYGDRKGTPVFFLHGWPSCRIHAERIDNQAKEAGVRLISPDRPGLGLSDYQSNRTLLDYPDDLVELADKLGIKKFAVMGVSGGGPYAAVCAYKIPHRVTKVGIVVGLAPTWIKGICEGMGFFNKLGWENYHLIPALRYISPAITYIQAKYLPFLNTFGFRAKSDRALLLSPAAKQLAAKSNKQTWRQGIKGAYWDLKLYTQDWGFKLENIKSKVHLWYGDVDKNVSLNMARYYASQIPNNELTIYPNEGHLLQVTNAKEILTTLTK